MRNLIILLLLPLFGYSQELTPVLLTDLLPEQNETSGLLRVGGDTWVILDSANPNELYRVDLATGQVLQEVLVTNATNVDWEEVTTDGTYVYIGDFGNNAGARSDLCIYRFPLSDLNAATIEVTVDTIRFHYMDQTDFTPAYDNTNWDGEAFIALGDSLFIFTKNWLDGHTHIYALPALPGTHVAVRRGAFDTQGLITAAAIDPGNGHIVLLGHSIAGTVPFIWTLRDYPAHDFFGGNNAHHPLAAAPLQAEAIAFRTAGTVIIGNEWSPVQMPALWSLELPMAMDELAVMHKVIHAYPVPADRSIAVEGADVASTSRVIDLNGAALASMIVTPDGSMDLPYLEAGEYILEVFVRSHLCRLPLIIAH